MSAPPPQNERSAASRLAHLFVDLVEAAVVIAFTVAFVAVIKAWPLLLVVFAGAACAAIWLVWGPT